MKKNLQRYRARTEWNGIELFDREEGRVIALNEEASESFLKLINNKAPRKKAFLAEFPPGLASLRLFHQDDWDVEPLIDTPFDKTAAFASAPRRIYWELTRNCNLNCKACFNRFFISKEELSYDTILSIAGQLYKAGVYEIRCTGGEPTQRPDFFEIAAELADLGFYLSMGTNGIYSRDTLQKVLASPIAWIIMSLDGSDASTHEEIRGKGNFEHSVNTLEQLAGKACRIRINTLIRKTNYKYEHLKGLAGLCDRFGVESLNCIPLRPLTNDPGVLDSQITPQQFKEFIQGLNRLRQEHEVDFITTLDLRHTNLHDRIYFKDRSCAAGREGAVISPYGEIYGCSYSLASIPDAPPAERSLFVAGNLLEDEFLKIWNRSERWAIYRDLEKYKHRRCRVCDYYIQKRCIGNCPVMNKNNPAAFDPYCYLDILDIHDKI